MPILVMAPAVRPALGEISMFRWMLGFVVLAAVAGYLSSAFNLAAAQTVSVVCLILAVLMLASAMFEKTASA